MLDRLILSVFLFAALPAHAAEERAATNGVLVELFTSQGCYSCPPADALLQDIAPREGVIALEFHVDYWNDLIYGLAGKWEDPFSSPHYTERQYAYDRAFSSGMYTPQFIVHGQGEVVGSRARHLEQRLAEAQMQGQQTPLQFFFTGNAAEGLQARVAGLLHGDEDFYYAVFHRTQRTEVTAGENKGKMMENTNVVHTFKWRRGVREINIPPFDATAEDCAVWVQKPQTGKVLAAAACGS